MAESIGHSQFEMVYREQVRLPVDIIVETQSRMPNAAHLVQHIQQLVLLQEGFGLSSSPVLPGRGAGLWCGLVQSMWL